MSVDIDIIKARAKQLGITPVQSPRRSHDKRTYTRAAFCPLSPADRGARVAETRVTVRSI